MQIGCHRFGCQKAVEVCYWSCKYRKGCKDWKQALEGDPGEEAIRLRLESASARTGRSFDLATLVLPGRKRRARRAAKTEETQETERSARKKEKEGGRKRMARSATSETEDTEVKRAAVGAAEETGGEARAARAVKKPRPAAKRGKPATTGPVYLLLSPNGKYRELNESELAAEAAHLLKDPSLRLVKGQFLIPQITFRPADE